MVDREEEAKRLDELAAHENGLAKSQTLAAEADRLRRTGQVKYFRSNWAMPLLRN